MRGSWMGVGQNDSLSPREVFDLEGLTPRSTHEEAKAGSVMWKDV